MTPRRLQATVLLPLLVTLLLTLLITRCTRAPPEPTLAEKALAIAAVFETTHPYSARTVDSLGLTAFFDKYPGYRSDSASVMDFYRRRAMQFAWIVRDSLSASAGAFVALAGVAHTGDSEANARGPSLRELYDEGFAEGTRVPSCESCAVDLELRLTAPSNRIVPVAGLFRPMRYFSRVLLPLPLPPMTTKISPRRTSNDRSRMTTRSPYAIVRSLTSMHGASSTRPPGGRQASR